MINQYLADSYCSITVANHRLSRSLDSSRDLQPIHAKSFVNRLHLVLHVCVETFDVMFFCLRGIWGGNCFNRASSTSDAPDLPSRDHICWLVPALSNHSDIAHVSLRNDHSPLSFWMFML